MDELERLKKRVDTIFKFIFWIFVANMTTVVFQVIFLLKLKGLL